MKQNEMTMDIKEDIPKADTLVVAIPDTDYNRPWNGYCKICR
jgi:hypothetical protein